MKAIISSALLTVFVASAAHAEGLQVETRAFHANMRVDAKKITFIENGRTVGTTDMSESFFNTAGFGVAGVYSADDTLDLGLGLSLARYYPNNGVTVDQTVLNGFSRFNLVKTEAGKFYVLVGLSRQQLSQDVEDGEDESYKSSFTPIVNADAGIGGSIKLGAADLGLEYKYTNTLAKGRASLHNRYTHMGVAGMVTETEKTKIKDTVLEGHELALTLGVQL